MIKYLISAISSVLFVALIMACPATLSAEAATALGSEESVLESALKLYRKGLRLLRPTLESANNPFRSYGDGQYMLDFPFSNYPITDVPVLGRFFIDYIPDTIKSELRCQKPWEPHIAELIKQYALPGTTALDIGAHIGSHTLTMSDSVGAGGHVLAFDPNKKIFRELCFNLALNGCQNVIPLKCALGKISSLVQVVPAQFNNEGGAYVMPGAGEENLVPILPLDLFELHNVSLIKIDVENVEADVLDGAFETIKRNRPVIIIEIQGNSLRAERLAENTKEMQQASIDRLHALGYELYALPSPNDYLALPMGADWEQ